MNLLLHLSLFASYGAFKPTLWLDLSALLCHIMAPLGFLSRFGSPLLPAALTSVLMFGFLNLSVR